MRLAEVIYNNIRLRAAARRALDSLKKDQVADFLYRVEAESLPWAPIGKRHIYLALQELEMVFFIDPERNGDNWLYRLTSPQ